MSKKILLVVNPISGNTNKDTIITAIEEECSKNDFALHFFKTTGENDVKKLSDVVKKTTFDRILIAGGDGTIKMVAEAIEGLTTSVGIIAAGSANGLAVNFNIPDTIEGQLKIALGSHTIAVDKLLINNHICLHMADLGINAELINHYESSNIRGKLGYILQVIPTLVSCPYPFTFTIKNKNKTIEEKGIMLAIANANKFGTGANINPNGKINDGKFELLVFKELNITEILNTIYDKANIGSDFAEEYPSTAATIEMNEAVPLQIDGEFIENTKKVNVTICSDKLNIAVPKNFSTK